MQSNADIFLARFLNLIFFRHFSPSSTTPSPYVVRSSHFSSSRNYSSSPIRQEEDVMVYVWWNSDRCKLPVGFDITELAPTLCAALRANGIKGPVHQIKAFGDRNLLSRQNRRDLQGSLTGINFEDVPEGRIERNYAQEILLADVFFWMKKDRPPANLFFVGFTPFLDGIYILNKLRFRNFNILLATNEAPAELLVTATIWWDWKSLISGKELAGHHFSPPPDGFSDSLYGHFEEADIEDPFSFSTSTLRSRIRRVVAKDILKTILHKLKSHPDGIALEDLHSEVVNVTKKYYGSEKFLRMIKGGAYYKHLDVVITFKNEVIVRLINL